jgi:histone-lysine N-methyltransferase SUV39H
MAWTGNDKSINGFVYNEKGKVLNPGYPIFECNDACECSEECMNRVGSFDPGDVLLLIDLDKVIQYGRKHVISIMKTEEKGWGEPIWRN